MKTLQDLAKQYRKSAAQAIFPGLPWNNYEPAKTRKLKSGREVDNPNWLKWNKLPKGQKSRAFDKGNLLSTFLTSPYNALDNIARETDKGYELVLEVGPDGAQYGRYVHYGTIKMDARPFAELGAEEPKFISVMDEFMEGVSDDFVDKEMETFTDYFKKAGFKIS